MKSFLILLIFSTVCLFGQDWSDFINNNNYFNVFANKIKSEASSFQKPDDFLNFSSKGVVAIKDNYRNQHTESLWTFGDLNISFANGKITEWAASNYLTMGHQGLKVDDALENFAYSKEKFGVLTVQQQYGNTLGHYILSSVEGVDTFKFIGWGVELQNRSYNSGNFWALFAFGTEPVSAEAIDEINNSDLLLSYEGKFLRADHKTGKVDPDGIVTLFFDLKNRFFFGQMQDTEGEILKIRGILHKFDRKMEAEIYSDEQGKNLGKLVINPFGNPGDEIGGTFILNLSGAGSTGLVALKRLS